MEIFFGKSGRLGASTEDDAPWTFYCIHARYFERRSDCVLLRLVTTTTVTY